MHDPGNEDGPESYVLSKPDRAIVAAATQLLFKILGSTLPDAVQREVVARVGSVVSGMPRASEPLSAYVSLTGPRRWFGEHEIYHWWTIEVEDQVVRISANGHFYRQSTGGDSFASLRWEAMPGEPADLVDRLDSLSLVDDAAPFPDEVLGIDLSEEGYSLELMQDGEPILGDEHEAVEDESDEDAETETDEMSLEAWDRRLDQFADLPLAHARRETHLSPPDNCDLCGRDLAEGRYFVDGARRASAEWACMCSRCFAGDGNRIAYGSGQLYARQADDCWLLVGGFPAEDETGR